MKYVAMIYGNQGKWDSFPAEAWPEAIAKQEAFNANYRETASCWVPTAWRTRRTPSSSAARTASRR
ncbi:hypothetical protein [Saccharopolyspora hattusasensis]|uniref:hypothetical protein n=1 Tax=Saccharopolyspora hattusasensis TaxID=1128679 RepID=UPI003D97F3BF